MKLLSRVPIEKKLTFVMMAVTIAVLVVACVAFLVYDQMSYRETVTRHLKSLAISMSDDLNLAMISDDSAAWHRAFAVVDSIPFLECITIVDSSGAILRTYPESARASCSFTQQRDQQTSFEGNEVTYYATLRHDGRNTGGYQLCGTLEEMHAHFGRYLRLVSIFLLIGPLIAYLLASRLSQYISRPIAHLTDIAASVSRDRDYSLRADRTTDDEIGYLIETFNDMLHRLGQRDREIQRAQRELESWAGKLELELTERRKTEDALRLSEERLKSALRVARMGTWRLDIRSKQVWGSEESYALYGLEERGPTISLGVTEDLVHPDDRERKSTALHRFLAGEASYDIEFRITRANDGAVRYMHSKAKLVHDDNGEPVTAEGIIQDITDRKLAMEALYQSEQMLQLVLNNVPQRVFWKDLELRYLGCNQSFADDAGIDSPLSIIGKSDYQLAWNASADLYRRDDRTVMETNKPKLEFEEPQELANGTIRWLRTSKTPLHDRNGKVIGVLGTYDDITERKRAEEHRDELQAKLERAQRMESLGILAGGVAHDLNNMLGPMVGYPELILRNLPEVSPIRRQVEKISSAARSAADVIQDLLALARRGRYDMKSILLNDVVRDYLESASYERLTESRPGIEVGSYLADELPRIQGSETHLSKVVMNLIVNAFDAMGDSGRLQVRTGRASSKEIAAALEKIPPGEYVVLSVQDSGSGIDPADLGKIFEPYYSKKKMKLGGGGSGLGLSVVYGILKDHKGYYDVRSQVGEGTTFSLFFPVSTEEGADETRMIGDIGGHESILVVDDSEAQRDIAGELLESIGYRVKAVPNGRAAVVFLQKNEVDLVLLDMIMEDDFDGLDTYREILKIRPGQPTLIVSGYSATDRVNEMQRLGAGAYIRKPYTLEQIGQAIRNELSRAPAKQLH